MKQTDVIRRPVITEKTTLLREDGRTLVFEVAPGATKIDIKRAVEKLLGAKVEGIRTAIAHGMKALCDFPEQRRLLTSDLGRTLPSAVEEMIRWATPVISFRRTTTRPVTLGGQEIGAGEKVVMFYNSANRDASAFTRPFAFDVQREPNEHVGFGGGGTHFCLGAGLARREMSALFRELLTRVPSVEISGEPHVLKSGFVHGVKRMPCSFRI